MEYVLGIIAMTLGLIVTFVGFPMQVVKNWKSKTTGDLSFGMWMLSFLSSLSWVAYGFFREVPDYFLVIPSFFGSLFAGIIVAQIIIYKDNSPKLKNRV